MITTTPKVFPLDVNGFGIGTLAYGANASLSFTGAGTDRVELPTLTPGREDVFRLAATENCFVNFGDDTVTAATTDIFFPAGVETIKVPTGATHIAAIDAGTNGILSVTEMV